MHADGRLPTRLTTDEEFAFSAWPNWSPDGSRIAFESNRDNLPLTSSANGADIYVMNADGSAPVRLPAARTPFTILRRAARELSWLQLLLPARNRG